MKKSFIVLWVVLVFSNLFNSVFALDCPKVGKDGIITKSSYKINYIYPTENQDYTKILFPGNRGPNQLVIYKTGFDKTTGTNEYGTEAIVRKDRVVKLFGANSKIPNDGYVISGHGTAKKWIVDNVKVGTKIKIDEKNLKIEAYTDVESYKYYANEKIEEVERIIKTTLSQNTKENQKLIKKYLKKAKSAYKKARKNNEKSLKYALQSIELSGQALNYSLPYIETELKGVWVRPTEKTKYEVEKTVNEMYKIGINTVFLETFFHGKTIFPSETMTSYGFSIQNEDFKEFDVLGAWLEEGRKKGINIHTWIESFYIGNKDPKNDSKNILTVKPEWGNKDKLNADNEGLITHPTEHNGYFLDPANPEVTNFLYELIYEICAKYDIAGINIDYVRYPSSAKPNLVSYERTNWGYTNYAREEFKTIYLIDPITIEANTPDWQSWDNYRQEKINNYVKTISNMLKKRNIMFSTVVFPNEENCLKTKQQNWQLWAQSGYLDAITPLILTSDYELTGEIFKNIKKETGKKAEIYPGIFAGFMKTKEEDLLKQYHAIRKEGFGGIILFDWAHLDKKYSDVLKSSAFLKNANE